MTSKKKTTHSSQTADLRNRAEKIALETAEQSLENIDAQTPAEIRQTFHELRVHQIELDIQDEELRRSQAELEDARMRYFDLYDMAPVGYLPVSKEGLIQECNLTAVTMLGATGHAQLANRPLSQFVFKEDQNIYYLKRNQLFETSETQTCELRMLKKDTTAFWAGLIMTAVQGADGTPECRIVMADITIRKQAEAERYDYQMRLEAIFNTVPDCIVTVDRDMRVLQCNEAFKTHTGMTAPIANLNDIPISCSQSCHAAIRETLASGGTVREYRVACERVDRPGQVSIINSSPLKDRFGSFIGALVVIRDITAITQLEQRLGERTHHRKIVGASSGMKELFQHIDSLANQDTTVLIIGESGTGKDLVAEALHYGGRRSFKPFVKVNCSALVENLLESELFGHAKGAFTGATRSHTGWFQKAHGGSIFLDEIGDISPRIQLKLLRVLEEKAFEPIGDTKTVRVDVRIITATHQNLREKMRQGEFRQDLFHRLNVMQLRVPPLRERQGDISLLTDHFLTIFSKKFAKTILGVANDVLSRFIEYPWPGNVRELEHTLERACLLCQGAEINLKDLPIEISEYQTSIGALPTDKSIDHQRLLQILSQTEGNIAKAARLLGVSRPTIYRKMAEARLTRKVRP